MRTPPVKTPQPITELHTLSPVSSRHNHMGLGGRSAFACAAYKRISRVSRVSRGVFLARGDGCMVLSARVPAVYTPPPHTRTASQAPLLLGRHQLMHVIVAPRPSCTATCRRRHAHEPSPWARHCRAHANSTRTPSPHIRRRYAHAVAHRHGSCRRRWSLPPFATVAVSRQHRVPSPP